MIKSNNQSTCMEKMQRFQDYIKDLETERRKIQVFERELPLCLELVTQAIEGCKTQMFETMVDFHGESECFEQTSSEDPVLEEFIPMKKSSATDEDEDRQEMQKSSDKPKIICMKNKSSPSTKSNWLKSAQLSIQTPDPLIKQGLSAKKISVMEEVKRSECGAFHLFKKDKSCGAAPASLTSERGGGGSKIEDKDEHSQRKSRRCWSPELHRRFLHALQQLGGAHVATPKQIRELMKVDGLTNDEVKSHLQKYRLHTRRPSHKIHNNDSPQSPKFVVVGGLWMPPPEYTTMAASAPPPSVVEDTNNTKGVYIPTASLPPFISKASKSLIKMLQQSHSSCEKGTHRHCDSPSASSMHTTTASAGAAF